VQDLDLGYLQADCKHIGTNTESAMKTGENDMFCHVQFYAGIVIAI
jgi:hypothetical protein